MANITMMLESDAKILKFQGMINVQRAYWTSSNYSRYSVIILLTAPNANIVDWKINKRLQIKNRTTCK